MYNYTEYPKGSEWRKWDLHFHTPLSYDYKDKSITNQDIIDGLVQNNVSVVAITDHHVMDIEKITELTELAKTRENKITVLPGIEFLCESRGSDPIHFIAIFPEDSNIQYIWDQIKNKTNIHRIEGERKRVNEIYCNLEETAQLIKSLGGLISIHAGSKTNTIDNITNALPHGTAQKEDIAKLVDIFELGKEADIQPYTNIVNPYLQQCINKSLPLILCSDSHNIREYAVKQNLWIKADPTFEGLKQVLYEPSERVKIQPTKPENKPGYQVIDHIEVKSDSIFNTKISLNPNLNSIIGGRSSGKSVLLGSIAKKLKSSRPLSLSSDTYQAYVQSISESINVIWKDEKEEDDREVEYFEQSYMNDIARDETKLNKIIRDILIQKGKEPILDEHNKAMIEVSKLIAGLIIDYFLLLNDVSEKEQKLRDKGDKSGVEEEISKLTNDLNQLSITEILEEEKKHYEDVKQQLSINSQQIQASINDILLLNNLLGITLFKENIDYEITSLSVSQKQNILDVFSSLKAETNRRWKEELEKLIAKAEQDKGALTEKFETLNNDTVYTKVSQAYKENVHLSEFEEKIKAQKSKLFEITTLLDEITSLKHQLGQLKDKIKVSHKNFFNKTTEVISQLSISKDGLQIRAKYKFENNRYCEVLSAGINLQGRDNQNLANYQYDSFDSFEKHQFILFQKLEKNELILKGGQSNQSLLSSLLSTNFFSLSYDIEYEGDDFKKMSEGKKAFVVLKLLLDFNDKNCPILIDQPEDDLDNRAIYNDLVKYIREKKKLRQIILATHNPNIVVGADSELVICANQHGEKNCNNGDKQFQYVAGSLEHTFPRNDNITEILKCQGTREHVCEVLEGGNIAFKLREKKYSIEE